MSKCLKNSAKCTACGVEIESKFGHDFQVHYCEVEPTPGKKWVTIDGGEHLVDSGETTWRFAVDGGRGYYTRRCGGGFEDTSIYAED